MWVLMVLKKMMMAIVVPQGTTQTNSPVLHGSGIDGVRLPLRISSNGIPWSGGRGRRGSVVYSDDVAPPKCRTYITSVLASGCIGTV